MKSDAWRAYACTSDNILIDYLMSFFKKIFGGGEEKKTAPPPPPQKSEAEKLAQKKIDI